LIHPRDDRFDHGAYQPVSNALVLDGQAQFCGVQDQQLVLDQTIQDVKPFSFPNQIVGVRGQGPDRAFKFLR
jgi:hypothetical protein